MNFTVGDRVEVISANTMLALFGQAGVIRCIEHGSDTKNEILIEFDYYIGGHNGLHYCKEGKEKFFKDGYCWWVEIKLLKSMEEISPIEDIYKENFCITSLMNKLKKED